MYFGSMHCAFKAEDAWARCESRFKAGLEFFGLDRSSCMTTYKWIIIFCRNGQVMPRPPSLLAFARGCAPVRHSNKRGVSRRPGDNMRKHLYSLLAACMAATFIAPAVAAAESASYPDRPIKIVVPFPAGGTSDVLGRLVGDKLAQAVGQPVIVENRAGANGNIGADYVVRSEPDGYTLLLLDLGNLTISPSVYPNLPYDPVKDLEPVSMLAYSPHLLVTTNELPVKTQEELIQYAKDHKGKLNFAAAAGIGSAPHMAGVLFAQKTGIDWGYIPYKGGAQALSDLIGGQVDVTTNGMVATYPHVKSGKIRLLAVTSSERLPQLPDVPTVGEIIPGFVTGSWQGILAPAGTPKPVVEKLNAELAKIIELPDVKAKLDTLGAQPLTMSPDEFGQWTREQVANWAVVVKEAGIKIE